MEVRSEEEEKKRREGKTAEQKMRLLALFGVSLCFDSTWLVRLVACFGIRRQELQFASKVM